jgi:hypothetical protein
VTKRAFSGRVTGTVTVTDSLGIPQQIRKQRIGHSTGSVTEIYTHTFTQGERAAAEKLNEFFGTGSPETDKGELISFLNIRLLKNHEQGQNCLVLPFRLELIRLAA